MPGKKDLRVWDVYNLLRTTRLNIKFYSHFLSFWKQINLIVDVFLGLTASSSAVAGWCVWSTSTGEVIWLIISMVAGVVVIVKPFFKIGDRIEAYEKATHDYLMLQSRIEKIVFEIKQAQAYRERHQILLEVANDMLGGLKVNPPDKKEESNRMKRIKRDCQNEIMNELPNSCFFIPTIGG
jgi:hypothetical protein